MNITLIILKTALKKMNVQYIYIHSFGAFVTRGKVNKVLNIEIRRGACHLR
jgi:hypothetical protein